MYSFHEPAIKASAIKTYGIMLTQAELNNPRIREFLEQNTALTSLYCEIYPDLANAASHSRIARLREEKIAPSYQIFSIGKGFSTLDLGRIVENENFPVEWLTLPAKLIPDPSKGLITEGSAKKFLDLVVRKDPTLIAEMIQETTIRFEQQVKEGYFGLGRQARK